MKYKEASLYVDIVQRIALQSRARRLQVGALLVTSDDVLIIGYNGTPSGWDNNCEDEIFYSKEISSITINDLGDVIPHIREPHVELKTKYEVIHAEMNVYRKAANSQNSIKSGTLFLTHPPCHHCAKLYLGTGLKELVYINDYKSSSSDTDLGVNLLKKDGIKVTKWSEYAEV